MDLQYIEEQKRPTINNNYLNYISNDNDLFQFAEDWLYIEEIELKILLLTSILAENNFAFRGTLSTICNWLCIKSSSNNNRKIKEAIFSLSNKGLIHYVQDKRTLTISITDKAFKDSRIEKLRKDWINTLKSYNRDTNNKTINKSISIDYIKIIKVFIYIYFWNDNNSFFTQKELADNLNMSSESIRKALNAIQNTNLKGLQINRKVIKFISILNDNNVLFSNLGTNINISLKFD